MRNAGPDWWKVDEACNAALKLWPSEMVQHVLIAVSYIHDLTAHLDQNGTPYTSLIEERVDASSFTCEGQFGTLDYAAVVDCGRLRVIDYKHGRGVVVEVRTADGHLNPQAREHLLDLEHGVRIGQNQTPHELFDLGQKEHRLVNPMVCLVHLNPRLAQKQRSLQK